MAGDKFDQLYNALKADGAVSGTREHFRQFVYAPGKQGYHNRKQLYDALHADGAVSSKSYEEFAQRLGLHAVNPKPHQKPVAQQKPMTTSQRAQNMAAQYQQGKQQKAQQPSTSTTSGTYYMKNWMLLNKRPDQMTPLEMSQASNMREQSRKVRERYVAEQKKRATPISSSKIVPSAKSFDELLLDFDTPEARRARAKQQHEDDINQMAYQGVGQNLGKDIFAMTDKAIDLAEQSSKDFFKGAEDALGFSQQYDPRIQKSIADAADMRKSTETIQQGLQVGLADKVQEYFSRPEIQKNVMDTAEKMNISLEEAVQKYYMPNLMQYAKDAVEQRQLEKVLPQGFFDYLGKNLSNTVIGMILSNAMYSKEERQRRQRALAISEGLEEAPQMVGHNTDYYKAGVLSRAAGTGVNMLADSPVFGVGGTAADMAVNTGSRILARGLEKAGLKAIGKVLTPREMAFKAANMSMAQKMMSGLTTGTAKSALNLGGYSSITGGLQQISTGEDSSPAAVAMAAITSGWHGAKTGAMFGFSGGVMHPWASRYGITGLERNAEQRFIHGAQKVGATAASVGVEAGTMMVADHLQADKEICFAQWL